MDSRESCSSSKSQDSSIIHLMGKRLSHQDTLEMVQDTLTGLVRVDPLLSHLPVPLTLDEVNSMIALEYGQAMTVNVSRGDGEVMPVIVEQTATVLDLKKAIQRYVTLKQTRLKEELSISWRYVWRTYWLYFDAQKLDKDHGKLKDYLVKNRDTVTFVKKLKDNSHNWS